MEYMARFNEETIKVSHLNQEMFVGVFQHDLKAGKFNESLAQKSASNMDKVITRAEFYIKGEERNMEKDPNMQMRKCGLKNKESNIGRNTLSQDIEIDK